MRVMKEIESVIDTLMHLRDDICNEVCKYDEKYQKGEYTEAEIEKICEECPIFRTL